MWGVTYNEGENATVPGWVEWFFRVLFDDFLWLLLRLGVGVERLLCPVVDGCSLCEEKQTSDDE